MSLAQQLLSYDSLKAAVVDREEDFSTNPRFSQPLLRDVLKILRDIPDKVTAREFTGMVERLVLPTTEITIPSHTVTALLEVVILTLTQSSKSNDLKLEDAHAAQELLIKLQSIQIYYTAQNSQQEMEEWKRSIVIALNLTLNIYASVASTLYDTEASKQVVQFAENLLMESGSSPSHNTPERLQLQPDVISFNTVMMAWAKSVQKSHGRQQRHDFQRKKHAVKTAAERAEAILKLLLEISQEIPSLQPTAYSYTAAMAAWAHVVSDQTPNHVFRSLLKPMVDRCYQGDGPAPTGATLVTACKSLLHHSSAKELKQHVKELLHYQTKVHVPLDIILCNSILTAHARMEPTDKKDYLTKSYDMISFFDTHVKNPDRISYMTVLSGIRQAIHTYQPPDNKLALESKRILQQAGGYQDTRMHNDVLGALCFHADAAEELFEQMGDSIDYDSYQYLLNAYECSSRNSNSSTYPLKAEELLKQMEVLSETNLSLRPQTNEYNSAILAWLETKNLEGVDRAASVLQGLLEKYQQRLEEMSSSQYDRFYIAERPNTTSFIPIMAGYSKHGSIEHIAVVEHMLQQMGDLQLAKSQATANQRKKMAPIAQNAVATNVLLDMYARYSKENPEMLTKADNLLKRMDSMGTKTKPDEYSYTIVLKAYAAAGESIVRTMRLLEMAKRSSSGVVPLRVYNAALNALANSSDEESARAADGVFKDMQQHRQPDAFSFAAVIKVWSKMGTLEGVQRADQALQLAIRSRQVDSFCFNSVISGYAQLKTPQGTDRAKEIYYAMLQESNRNKQVRPNAFTYQNLTMNGTPEDSQDILVQMMERYQQSGRQEDIPDGKAFSHVISRWFHDQGNDASSKAEEVLQLKLKLAADNNGPIPTKYDIDSVVKKLASVGKVDRAESLLDEMYSQHSWAKEEAVSTIAYNGIFFAYATQSASAESAVKACSLLAKMEERHRDGASAKPDGQSYGDCIATWVQSRDPFRDEKSEELMRRMMMAVSKDDFEVTRAFNLVLKACKQCAERNRGNNDASVQRGARVFGEMMKLENVVNASSYAYMLNLTSYMEEEDRKVQLYQKLILQCQKAGFVSESVLGTFLWLAPPALSAKAFKVKEEHLGKLRLKDLPREWGRNVQFVKKPTAPRSDNSRRVAT